MHQRLNLSTDLRAPRLLWAGALVLLMAALLIGGATREGHLLHAGVRLLSLPVLLLALWSLRADRAAEARAALILLAATATVPLLQLLPMPPGLWQALPGRAGFAEAYRAADMPMPWLPVSLDRDATWNAALSLLPAIAMFLATLHLEAGQRRALVPWIIAVVAVSILLGISQVAGGEQSRLRFYEITNVSAAVGFFSNRNHQASLLVAALPLIALWTLGWAARGRRSAPLFITLGVGLALAVAAGVGVSESRAGIVLLVPACVGSLLLVLARGRFTISRRNAIIVAVIAAAGAIPAFAFGLARILKELPSSLTTDARLTASPAIAREALANLPIGTGLGTFDPVYRALETPQTLTNAFLNHAHNDYLELFLETGVFGPLLIVLFLVWFGRAAWSVWIRERGDGLAQAASLSILVLLAHSAVDYPLRTAAISTLFAFLCGCMVAAPTRASIRELRT